MRTGKRVVRCVVIMLFTVILGGVTPSSIQAAHNEAGPRIIAAPPVWMTDIEGYENFYKKCIYVYGIPICATDDVPNEALYKAYDVLEIYLRKIHTDYPKIIDQMHKNRVNVIVIGEHEYNYMHPSWAPYEDDLTERRGGGAVDTTVLVEDLLVPSDDVWRQTFAGLVHEFTHTTLAYGIGDYDNDGPYKEEIYGAIQAAYDQAMEAGKYSGENVYDQTNYHEYFCGQVGRWFNGSPTNLDMDGATSMTDREQLAAYDPAVYTICQKLFGEYELPKPWGDGTSNEVSIDTDTANMAPYATVTTSYCSAWENFNAVNDFIYGETSAESNLDHYGTYGNLSDSEWVCYTWDESQTIDKCNLYLWNDNGGIMTPKSYRYEYLDASGAWQPVKNAKGYGCILDTFNETTFDVISTKAIRVTLRKTNTDTNGVGIVEWQVNRTARKVVPSTPQKPVEPALTLDTVTKVKAVSDGSNAITISWKKNSEADSYLVQRKIGKEFVTIATVKKTAYTDKKRKSSTTYQYRIRVCKMSGTTTIYSPDSKVVKATTGPEAIKKITVKKVKTGYQMKWKKVSKATGYIVYQKKADGKYHKIKTLGKNTTKYTLRRLKAGKKYTYCVKTVRKSGKTSYLGSSKKVTVKPTK